MKTFTVKIFRDGQHVDTQTVQEADEGKAKTRAMIQTRVRFNGAEARYEVEEVHADA